jgi:hypothetical protein
MLLNGGNVYVGILLKLGEATVLPEIFSTNLMLMVGLLSSCIIFKKIWISLIQVKLRERSKFYFIAFNIISAVK